MITFFINFMRVIYNVAGVWFVFVSLLAGMVPNLLGKIFTFIFCIGLGAFLLWAADMMGKRKTFIPRIVFVIQGGLAGIVMLTLIGMVLDRESLLYVQPLFYIGALSFWFVLAIFPAIIFLRPRVAGLFNR